jgi:hypothetical protein
MPLVTLFSAPKPFTDPHIATIQRNAIQSWTHLTDVNILLMGAEEGLARVAGDLGVKHFPDVACNARGTPLISSMFRLARESSGGGLLCVINTDIILTADFVTAAESCRTLFKRDQCFVLLGQRWDLNVTEAIDFAESWQSRLRSAVHSRGRLHRPAGSDYFLFPTSCYADVPDFAIGRAGWDNWMIYMARRQGWPVIDATESVTAIHQDHGYGHLPGGQSHYSLPESDENVRLAGGAAISRFTILDATARLVDGKILPLRPSWGRFWRGVELFLRRALAFLPDEKLEQVVRPKRWKKRIRRYFGSRES